MAIVFVVQSDGEIGYAVTNLELQMIVTSSCELKGLCTVMALRKSLVTLRVSQVSVTMQMSIFSLLMRSVIFCRLIWVRADLALIVATLQLLLLSVCLFN